jgi:NADPH:quinone reductase-like Zn-dependent oxidoreductase
MTKIKAAVFHEYGTPEVLKIEKIEKPNPKESEVLIKIYATPVTSGDCRMRRSDPFATRFITGLIKPKKNILGMHISGIIEKVGNNVTKFKVGDEVYGSCGMGFGAYSEYICLNENTTIIKKPKNATHEEAAAIIFGGDTAYHFLKKAGIKKGNKILVYGASGAVGTSVVQLANYFGAEVTAVCSESNFKLVKSLGAKYVIDYSKKDFTQESKCYDFIFDTLGKTSFSKCKNSLKAKGKFIAVNASIKEYFQMMFLSLKKGKKIVAGVAIESIEHLEFLKDLFEHKKLNPVIDKTYSLENIVDAHTYLETGRKKGNIVIKL